MDSPGDVSVIAAAAVSVRGHGAQALPRNSHPLLLLLLPRGRRHRRTLLFVARVVALQASGQRDLASWSHAHPSVAPHSHSRRTIPAGARARTDSSITSSAVATMASSRELGRFTCEAAAPPPAASLPPPPPVRPCSCRSTRRLPSLSSSSLSSVISSSNSLPRMELSALPRLETEPSETLRSRPAVAMTFLVL
jgi:hypothetical protein